jgi:hypothetical protein
MSPAIPTQPHRIPNNGVKRAILRQLSYLIGTMPVEAEMRGCKAYDMGNPEVP